eukprot:645484-Alexandrium_andersonii.AAC.1
MSASLVGSEMCIRDSASGAPRKRLRSPSAAPPQSLRRASAEPLQSLRSCLLYTSDAADDM